MSCGGLLICLQEVINLAREINAPALLPSAFYDLSRYQLSQIFEPSLNAFNLTSLSLADTQKLVLGKEAAQYAVNSLIRSMALATAPSGARSSGSSSRTSTPQPAHTARGQPTGPGLRHKRAGSCATAAACRKDVGELADLAVQHYVCDRERGYSDPLFVAEELGALKSIEGEGTECKACGRAFELWARKERERIWRSIPSWFRLDN